MRVLPYHLGMMLSMRAITVMDRLLEAKDFVEWEQIKRAPWRKIIRRPRRSDLAQLTLWDFKRMRGCGAKSLTEIYNEMLRIGVKPAFVWPEPPPPPLPPRERCTKCGHIYKPKHL